MGGAKGGANLKKKVSKSSYISILWFSRALITNPRKFFHLEEIAVDDEKGLDSTHDMIIDL